MKTLRVPQEYWVFGYGSLMWRPGFEYAETVAARLDGFRRDMCIQSIHYRGTPDAPGLVSGLTPGGLCLGRAYRVALEDVKMVVDYLDKRELVTDVYLAKHYTVALIDGRSVAARVYVADTEHLQFAGDWPLGDKIRYLLQGYGSEGRSIDYLENIVSQLDSLGMPDRELSGMLGRARQAEFEAN